jgi:predicted secreted protein
MPETIKTVTMTVDAVTATKINSIKLYVANNNSFTNAEVISVTPAKGDLTFNIKNPTANCFYKIEVDCASGSSNGLIQISKVVYTNK